MKCLNCENIVPDGNYCAVCGADQTIRNQTTLKEVYEKWVQTPKYKKYCQKTKEAYTLGWSQLETLHEKPVVSLRLKDFQRIIDDCEHLSMSYLSKIKQVSSHLLKKAKRDEVISHNFAMDIDLVSIKNAGERDILTDDEIKSLMDYAKNKNNKYWQAARITLVLVFTGFRPNELFNVTKESVNPKMGYMIGGMKTEAGKDRLVPIADMIRPIITEWYLQIPPSTAFETCYLVRSVKGKRVNLRNWRKREFYPLMHELGINRLCEEHRITPHCCRHTFASLCYRAEFKKELQIKIMGHTNFQFTSKVYIHNKLPEYLAEMRKLEGLFSQGKMLKERMS